MKRVNVDFDSYYAYVAGLPVPKRIDRRMKRSMRRNLWRYKTRRDKLKKLLITDGMYPSEELLEMELKDIEPKDFDKLASVLREMGDWMARNHRGIV